MSCTPSTVPAIWACTITRPWPTSAPAVCTSTRGRPPATASRTPAVAGRVVALVRTYREAARVGDDRGRARRVCPAVEKDAGLDVDELAAASGAVFVSHRGRMPVHVPDEGFSPRVGHLHGPSGFE